MHLAWPACPDDSKIKFLHMARRIEQSLLPVRLGPRCQNSAPSAPYFSIARASFAKAAARRGSGRSISLKCRFWPAFSSAHPAFASIPKSFSSARAGVAIGAAALFREAKFPPHAVVFAPAQLREL